MVNATLETEILKRRDPKITDDNDWPDFKLSNAEVLDPQTGEHCSLLLAGSERMLVVHGKLMKNKARTSYLLNKRLADTLPRRISLDSVQTFSYGQDDQGRVILWAAGAAGWFEIEPSRTYKYIYSSDCEAVNVLYSLVDQYREVKGKKLKIIPVEQLCQQYAAEPAHGCEDEAQAKTAFQRHRLFLLDCMRKGKEGINWKLTSIYEYLQQETQEDTASTGHEDEMHTPRESSGILPHSKHAGKGKSALRPRSSKHSQKGPSRLRSESDEDGDNDLVDTPAPLHSSRPSALLSKRSNSGRPGRSKSGPAFGNSMDDAQQAGEDDDTASFGVRLPFKTQSSTRVGNAKRKREPIAKIVTESLPSFESQGPGDVWTCPFDGCTHKVYAASNPKSGELIREHYQKHAVDEQAQIDLVLKEERPYLPVGNLVNKIREMAARPQVNGFVGGGGVNGSRQSVAGMEQFFPQPIQQRY